MGSGPHTSDSHTNKTQVWLFTRFINCTTSLWPIRACDPQHGQMDVVQFISPVNNQTFVLYVCESEVWGPLPIPLPNPYQLHNLWTI